MSDVAGGANDPVGTSHAGSRRAAIALLVGGLIPALVVYAVHWRRGYFLDDPFMDALSLVELRDSVVNMRARPLGTVLVAITYLAGEPAGRVLGAIALGATALLTALLVRRLCGGRYAPVVAVLLVTYPLLDFESALYWYAAIQYPAGAAFGLAGGHTFLSALRATTRGRAVSSGAASAVLFALGLACTETAVNFLLLLPGIAFVEGVRRKGFDRRSLLRLGATTGAAGVTVGALGAFIYLPKNEFTSARGGLILDPSEAIHRVTGFWLPALRGLAFSRQRGEIHAEAFRLGIANLRSPLVLCAFAVAIGLGLYAVREASTADGDPGRVGGVRAAAAMGLVGTMLFAVSFWFPAALLSGQGPVTRLLFTPWVAAVVVVVAAVAALEATGRYRRLLPVMVASVLAATIGLAVTLDGYGDLFRLRDARNDRQVAAWLELLRAAEPLPAGLRIVSLYGRDELLGRRATVDNTFAGITETPWALSRTISDIRDEGLVALGGHPFVPVCLAQTDDPTALRVTTFFNSEVVPIGSLLAAEVVDDRLLVVDEIRFGATVVELPLGRLAGGSFERLSLQTTKDQACRAFGAPAGP